MASILDRAGRTVDFEFERPVHRYEVDLPLRERPLPLWPITLFVLVLAVVGWAAQSERRARGAKDRSVVLAFAVASLALAWALTLLLDPRGCLADPWILLPGVFALATCRPLLLEVHRRVNGGRSPIGMVIVLAPGVVVGILGLWLAGHLLPASFGGVVAPGREDQLIDFLRAAAALVAVYHVVDLVVTFVRRDRVRSRTVRWSQVGLIAASFALVSAFFYGVNDTETFLAGGFVVHVAWHLVILWVADLAVLVMPVIQSVQRSSDRPLSFGEARSGVRGYLDRLTVAVGGGDATVVVVRGKRACAVGAGAAVTFVDDVVRDAVGLFRDEGVSLPVGEYGGDEPPVGVEVARGVAQSVGLTAAFVLIDEGAAALDHAEREAALFCYCIVRDGAPNLDPASRHELVREFSEVWPAFRLLAVDWMLGIDAPSSPSAVQAAGHSAVDSVPLELGCLRRDAGVEYPVDEPGLLPAELEAALSGFLVDDAPVILVGPAGAGKEFVARAYHRALGAGGFIKFPVSSTPPSLLGVELLGDGALGREGHVAAAGTGVLYVEDAGELGDELLTRLLDVVDAPRVVLGVRSPAESQVAGALGALMDGALSGRVLRLQQVVDRGTLRTIVDHYLLAFAMKHGKFVSEASDEVHAYLAARRWLGGVREVRSAVEVAVLRCDGESLSMGDFQASGQRRQGVGGASEIGRAVAAAEDLGEALLEAQREVYREALRRGNGNKTAAARLMGMKRSTFAGRLKALGGDSSIGS
jgi:hypothetical protein